MLTEAKAQYALEAVTDVQSPSMIGYFSNVYNANRPLLAVRIVIAKLVYLQIVQLAVAATIVFGSLLLATIVATGNSLTDDSFDRTRSIFGGINIALLAEAGLRVLVNPDATTILDVIIAILVVVMHYENIPSALLLRLPRGIGPIANFPVLRTILLPFLRIVHGLGALGRSMLFFLFFFLFISMGLVIAFFRSMSRRCVLMDPIAASPNRNSFLPAYFANLTVPPPSPPSLSPPTLLPSAPAFPMSPGYVNPASVPSLHPSYPGAPMYTGVAYVPSDSPFSPSNPLSPSSAQASLPQAAPLYANVIVMESIPGSSCSMPGDSGHQCPPGFECTPLIGPHFGLETFDFLPNSLLTVWHLISLSGWSKIVYAIAHSENVFFAPMALFMAYFLLHVILKQLFIASALSLLVAEPTLMLDTSGRSMRLMDPYGRPIADPFDTFGRLGVSGPSTSPQDVIPAPDGALLYAPIVICAAQDRAEASSSSASSDEGFVNRPFGRVTLEQMRRREARQRRSEARQRSRAAIPQIVGAYTKLVRQIRAMDIAFAVHMWLDVRLEQFAASQDVKASQLGKSLMSNDQSDFELNRHRGIQASSAAFGKLTGGTYTDDVVKSFHILRQSMSTVIQQETQHASLSSLLLPQLPPITGSRFSMEWNKSVHARIGALVTSPPFEMLVTVAVIANVVVLATFHVGMTEFHSQFIEWVENFFLAVYSVEQLMKIIFDPEGVRGYWSQRWNRFDLTLVAISWVSVLVMYTSGFVFAGGASLRSIRSVRLLRVLRNLRVLRLLSTLQNVQAKAFLRLHELNHLVHCTGETIMSLAPFIVLVFGIIAALALVTTSFLAGKLPISVADMSAMDPLREQFTDRVLHFDNLWRSVLVYVVHTTEDCRFQFVDAALYYFGWASLLVFIPSYILLNFLFPAILTARVLRHFNLSPLTLAQHSALWLASCNRDGHRAAVAVSTISSAPDAESVMSLAIQFFQSDRHSDRRLPHRHGQPIRRWISKIVRHPLFEIISVLLSLGTALALIWDDPQEAHIINKGDVLEKPSNIDVLLLLPFLFECALRFVAEPDLEEYFRSGWNRLDFIVLISMIIGFFLPRSRPLRILRVLRMLRLTLRVQALREVLEGLWSAVPALVDVLIMYAFTFLCFGLIGMNVLADTGATCSDSHRTHRDSCHGLFVHTMYDLPENKGYPPGFHVAHGILKPRTWTAPAETWNDIGESLLTLTVTSTFDSWHFIMFRAVDSNGPGLAPSHNATWWMAIFFIIFVFLVFILNALLVAVMLEHISAKRGNAFISRRQAVYRDTMRMLAFVNPYSMKPPKQGKSVAASIKRLCHRIASSGLKFDGIVITMIILNIGDACLRQTFPSDDLPTQLVATFTFTSFIFTAFFSVELLIRLVASRSTRNFFATSNWNLFDLFLVLASLLAIPLEAARVQSFGLDAFVKVCIVLRVLRLIPRVPMLRFFSEAIAASLPNIANIAFVLILIIFVYQHLGLEFFSQVRSGLLSSQRPGQNFRTYWDAFLLLFLNLTLDFWSNMMYDYRVAFPLCTDTSNPHWLIRNHPDWDDCGGPLAAPIFFVSFFVLGSYIFLNLVVATIVDSFISVIQPSYHGLLVPPDHLEAFQAAWLEADAVKCRGSLPMDRSLAVVFSLKSGGVLSSPASPDGESNRFAPQCPDSLNLLWGTSLQVALQLGVHRNPSWMRKMWWNIRIALPFSSALEKGGMSLIKGVTPTALLGKRHHYSFAEVATAVMILNVSDAYLEPFMRHERWIILSTAYRLYVLNHAKLILTKAVWRCKNGGFDDSFVERSNQERTRRSLNTAVIGLAGYGGTQLELEEMLRQRLNDEMNGKVSGRRRARGRALTVLKDLHATTKREVREKAVKALSEFKDVVLLGEGEDEPDDHGDGDDDDAGDGEGAAARADQDGQRADGKDKEKEGSERAGGRRSAFVRPSIAVSDDDDDFADDTTDGAAKSPRSVYGGASASDRGSAPGGLKKSGSAAAGTRTRGLRFRDVVAETNDSNDGDGDGDGDGRGGGSDDDGSQARGRRGGRAKIITGATSVRSGISGNTNGTSFGGGLSLHQQIMGVARDRMGAGGGGSSGTIATVSSPRRSFHHLSKALASTASMASMVSFGTHGNSSERGGGNPTPSILDERTQRAMSDRSVEGDFDIMTALCAAGRGEASPRAAHALALLGGSHTNLVATATADGSAMAPVSGSRSDTPSSTHGAAAAGGGGGSSSLAARRGWASQSGNRGGAAAASGGDSGCVLDDDPGDDHGGRGSRRAERVFGSIAPGLPGAGPANFGSLAVDGRFGSVVDARRYASQWSRQPVSGAARERSASPARDGPRGSSPTPPGAPLRGAERQPPAQRGSYVSAYSPSRDDGGYTRERDELTAQRGDGSTFASKGAVWGGAQSRWGRRASACSVSGASLASMSASVHDPTVHGDGDGQMDDPDPAPPAAVPSIYVPAGAATGRLPGGAPTATAPTGRHPLPRHSTASAAARGAALVPLAAALARSAAGPNGTPTTPAAPTSPAPAAIPTIITSPPAPERGAPLASFILSPLSPLSSPPGALAPPPMAGARPRLAAHAARSYVASSPVGSPPPETAAAVPPVAMTPGTVRATVAATDVPPAPPPIVATEGGPAAPAQPDIVCLSSAASSVGPDDAAAAAARLGSGGDACVAPAPFLASPGAVQRAAGARGGGSGIGLASGTFAMPVATLGGHAIGPASMESNVTAAAIAAAVAAGGVGGAPHGAGSFDTSASVAAPHGGGHGGALPPQRGLASPTAPSGPYGGSLNARYAHAHAAGYPRGAVGGSLAVAPGGGAPRGALNGSLGGVGLYDASFSPSGIAGGGESMSVADSLSMTFAGAGRGMAGGAAASLDQRSPRRGGGWGDGNLRKGSAAEEPATPATSPFMVNLHPQAVGAPHHNAPLAYGQAPKAAPSAPGAVMVPLVRRGGALARGGADVGTSKGGGSR